MPIARFAPAALRASVTTPLLLTLRATLIAAFLVAPPSLTAQGRSPGRDGVDVTNYALTLALPDTGATISGRAVLTVARPSHADNLRLDLIALHVDSVLVNDRATSFVRDDTSIRIPLPAGGNDTLVVAVRYAGAPSDGLIIRTDSTGRWTAFGDNWPQRARYWIPSIDEPGDKATVTWTVVAPSSRRVIANGELLEETPLRDSAGPVEMAGGMTAIPARSPRTLTRWRESRPIPPYLMVIAAAPLAYYDLGRSACGRSDFGGCVRQSVYVLPEDLPFLPGPFAQADDIVNWFSRIVAPFPYEKLAHLQSLTRFGGMENATAIFYNNESFRRRTLSVGTVAHETAHQWFGDAVTEETFADLWLSEGFATYWAELWTQHTQGDSAFRAGMAAMRREIIASPVTAARAVRDTVETDYLKLLNSNSYQKGGWVLHMLRSELGDSAFFRGVRAYYLAHRNGNARTDDLRVALERASGNSLGWFFDEWVRRPGYAELTTSWRYDRATHRVIVEIDQGSRFPPYRFPLTVEVRNAAGHSSRATIAVRAERSQHITLPLRLNAAPASLVFDPDITVLASFAER
ncbi:MAG TPA: M1 family metallopeptidase [Gemmatimonadaceae bacterium]|nr:M1 family metallopeptidase [Gemmatimonadaceae bacterium]